MANPNGGQGKCYLWLKAHESHQDDACLIWPFFRKETGYGHFGHMGKMHRAHRFMCELAHGPAPSPTHVAAHECGKGHLGCVNPKHLSWKTPEENRADRQRHGTAKRNFPGRVKLTAEQVAEIRSLLGKESQLSLAKRFGISRNYIYCIKAGLTWAEGKKWNPIPDADVIAIRNSPEPTRVIADRYGMSMENVRRIRRGDSYAHVTASLPSA